MSTSPVVLLVAMVAAGLVPFALVMLTSFVKMAVVLSIVRSALGAPQVPPNSVVTGLALVLSMVVMAPVASEAGRELGRLEQAVRSGSASGVLETIERAAVPVRRFLVRHAKPEHTAAFREILGKDRVVVTDDEEAPGWDVIVPAFVISELHGAFRMGFVIFLPFLVLDMLVASVLLSLGMHMLSPATIALPFKLLLFVFADGWTLIGSGLLGSYT